MQLFFAAANLAVALHWAVLCLPITSWADLVASSGGDLMTSSSLIALRSSVALFAVPMWGKMSDRRILGLGRGQLAAWCSVVSAVGYGTCGFLSESLLALAVGRMVVGSAIAVQVLVTAAVRDAVVQQSGSVDYSAELQGRMATLSAFSAVGFMCGVPAGGFLTTWLSPAAPERVGALLCVVNALLCFFVLRQPPTASSTGAVAVAAPSAKAGRGEDTLLDAGASGAGTSADDDEEAGLSWKTLLTSTELGSLRHILAFRGIWELAMGSTNNFISEMLRTDPVAAMEASSRGIFLMVAGALCIPVMQQTPLVVKTLAGGSDLRALQRGAAATTAVFVLLMLAPERTTAHLFVLLFSVVGCYVAPLTNSVASEVASDSQQGAVLGAAESLVNLGAIAGPLSLAFLQPIHPQAPPALGAALCFAAWLASRSLKKQDKRKEEKKEQ